MRTFVCSTDSRLDDAAVPPVYISDDSNKNDKKSGSWTGRDNKARFLNTPETIQDKDGELVPIPSSQSKLKYDHRLSFSVSLFKKKKEFRMHTQAGPPGQPKIPGEDEQCLPGIQSMNIQKSDHSSLKDFVSARNSSRDRLSATEEGLVVACPVRQVENKGPIYEATEYNPTSKTSFYNRRRCHVYMALLLSITGVVVALGLVIAAKKRADIIDHHYLNKHPLCPAMKPTKYCESIKEMIEDQVLERNATFLSMNDEDPRYLALNWILHDGQFQLSTDKTNFFQRYILAVIAFSFDLASWDCGMVLDLQSCNETDIEEYALWLSQTDECLWYGVMCVDGLVTSISLASNNLIGNIPPEIRGLRHLKSLLLSDNCIYGTIPFELWTLTSLSEIELEWNYLSGMVPSEIYELTSLTKLKLAGNNETGSCFHADGTQTNLTSTGLNGDIFGPKISKLSNLKEVSLYENDFHGSISSEIGTLSRLELFFSGRNMISGSLPKEISNLSSLRELWLGNNKITGSIPDSIGDIKSLEQLALFGMAMSGTIPISLYNLTNLKGLYLEENDPGYKGPIKSEIGNLLQLKELVLHDNPLLTGTLPTELGLCKNLKILQIQKTQLSGTVPQEVCALCEKKLNLDNNWNSYFFWADCLRNNKTLPPYFDCGCCSACCDHTTNECFTKDTRT
ncbi:hypothetical protein ACHAW6_008941 [Cyclotella cf. meneghiniana]